MFGHQIKCIKKIESHLMVVIQKKVMQSKIKDCGPLWFRVQHKCFIDNKENCKLSMSMHASY